MNKCIGIQKTIFEIFLAGAEIKFTPALEHHLQSCHSCRNYLNLLRESIIQLSAQNEKPLANPALKQKLTEQYKNSFNKKPPLFTSFRKIMEYRIPVYQVASAALILLTTFFAGQQFNNQSFQDYSGIQPDSIAVRSTSGYDYLIENIEIIKIQKVGFNAKEDSVLHNMQQPVL